MQSTINPETLNISVTTEYHKNSRGVLRETLHSVDVNGSRIYECTTQFNGLDAVPRVLADFMEWCTLGKQRFDRRNDG